MSTTTSRLGLVKPDVNDKRVTTIGTDLPANFDKLDAEWPVGSIYMSTKSTDPSTFLGGTWTALTGRFLVGAGTDYPAGTTGGEATHTLTVAEMPAHKHPLTTPNLLQNHVTETGGTDYGFITDGSWTDSGSAGGGAAHENMPPYRSVYMWERTA